MCSSFKLQSQNTCTMIRRVLSGDCLSLITANWCNFSPSLIARANWFRLFGTFQLREKSESGCGGAFNQMMMISLVDSFWVFITKDKIEIQMCDHHVSAKGQRFAREGRDLRESEPEMCNLLMT